MREILTLSLPSQTKEIIKKRSQINGFNSVSAYIQHLIKQEDDLISEDELWNEVQKARQGYKEGKLKKLNSIKDLI